MAAISQLKKFFSVPIVGAAVASLLLAADSVGSVNTVEKYLVLPSLAYALFFLVYAIYERMQGKFSFPPHLRKLLTVFTITIVAVTIAATLYDFYTPPNALYLQTRLQQEGLLILSLYLIILTLINQADAWWKKYWRWVALLLPLVCWGGGFAPASLSV